MIFAVRALLSVSKSATHTEDQTEPGSLMSEESELSLTAIQSQSIFVLVACVPERLHAQFDFMNLTEEQRRSSVFSCKSLRNVLHFYLLYVIM